MTEVQKVKKKIDPNSPWICVGCEEALEGQGEKVIECHQCKQWCHKGCSGLTDDQFTCLSKGDNFMLWLCMKCRESGRTEVSTRMETKLDNALKMLVDMQKRMDSFEAKHSACSADVIEEKIVEAVEIKVDEYMTEMIEKEKRKLNIIVANLSESVLETAEERKKEDKDRVRKLVGKIVDDISVDEVEDPVRLGPVRVGQNTRPRLLRVSVRTEETKKKIMRNVGNLNKNVAPQNRVYFNNDCTPKEREKIKKLKEELKIRKEAEPNLMINYKELKIVTRLNKDDQKTATLTGDGQTPVRAPAPAGAGKGDHTDRH